MSQPRALIVDDEPDIRELLGITLTRMELDVSTAANLEEARRVLRESPPDICLTDMRLPDGSGIELVRQLSEQYGGSIPVAVITAHGDMNSAVDALKAGAFDFVSKPVDLGVLRKLINTALRLCGVQQEGSERRREIVGRSEAIARVRAQVAKLARSQAPVFISGESGTGKELVARMIHEQGARADSAFVPVNCGAIPSELIESELFGHKKGSFTGAVADKAGLFQVADGGTLFLDEVGDLPLATQVKLLRAIQERSVRPVGAEQEVAVDVRVLSASHKDLEALVKVREFREDLYYRLVVIKLEVPPLRERLEDLEPLASHLLDRLGERMQIDPPMLSGAAAQLLSAYRFPGNVRQLENILERALALSEGLEIAPEDLGLDGVLVSPAPSNAAPLTATSTEVSVERATATGPPMAGAAPFPVRNAEIAPEIGAQSPAVESAHSDSLSLDGNLDDVLERVERETILRALVGCRWNKTAAARLLGISFGALRYRMQKLGLD